MGLSTAVAGQRITANLLNRMYGEADATSHVVTQAVSNPVSSSYTVVANDMSLNTAYRLTAFGIGTWGSTQQQLTFSLNYGGVSLATLNIAATAFSTSAAFRWKLTGLLVFTLNPARCKRVASDAIEEEEG